MALMRRLRRSRPAGRGSAQGRRRSRCHRGSTARTPRAVYLAASSEAILWAEAPAVNATGASRLTLTEALALASAPLTGLTGAVLLVRLAGVEPATLGLEVGSIVAVSMRQLAFSFLDCLRSSS